MLVIVFLLVIVYLLAIMPKMFNRKNFYPFENFYYAHRGLHNNNSDAPENSIKAFKLAVEHNYGIELDVRLTRDRVPVVFHDNSLNRACGVDKLVSEVNFDELSKYRLFNSTETIPSFEEVLKIIDGKVPLIVELKNTNNIGLLCETITPILDKYKGMYCIESFNPLIVKWYKEHRPHIIRGQLSSNFIKEGIKNDRLLNFLMQNLMLNFISKPDFIAFNYKYRNMFSFILCRKLFRIPTFAYTIDSKKAMEESRDSFDYFIFEGFNPHYKNF